MVEVAVVEGQTNAASCLGEVVAAAVAAVVAAVVAEEVAAVAAAVAAFAVPADESDEPAALRQLVFVSPLQLAVAVLCRQSVAARIISWPPKAIKS